MSQNLEPGMVLSNRFKLVERVGRGAMGQVWHSLDTHLDNAPTACKILNEHLAENASAVTDLKREVLLARRLRHPNILGVFTFWDSDGLQFMTMEYVPGKSLAKALAERERPFELCEVLRWAEGLSSALDFAHGQGILHRDVKPANMLLGENGTVYLVDFGIARTAEELRHTMSGSITSGTLLFMSPEQLRGQVLDPRSDQYSLATSLYELLSGHPPFYKGTVVSQIQLEEARPIPHLSEQVNRAMLKALTKQPEHRYLSCTELYRAMLRAARQSGEFEAAPVLAAEWAPAADLEEPTVELYPKNEERGRMRLGNILVRAGVITNKQLEEALLKQKGSRERLGAILVRLGYADELGIGLALESQIRIPLIALDDEFIDPEVANLITRPVARYRRCLPLRRKDDRVLVAVADPLDLMAVNAVEEACHAPADLRLALESDILRAIDRVYNGAG